MKLIKILLLSVILFSKPATAYIDPCMIPCALPCFLTNYGGPVVAVPEIGQRTIKGTGEIIKQTQYARQQVQGYAEKIMSAIQKLKNIAAQLMSGDFSVLSTETKNDTEKPVTQDTQPPLNATTAERVQRNLNEKFYGIEIQGGYKSEYGFDKRRTYIRHQATLKYISRVMVLKTKYKKIVDIVNEIEESVNESSKKASTPKNVTGMLKSTNVLEENKTALIQQTAELKAAWEQLLLIQKQIEAARLEYMSNIGLSNMKPVKFIPTIKGVNSSGDKK